MTEVLLNFAFNYMEYIVAGIGGIGIFIFFKSKKISNHSNDLTPLIIKLKKNNDAISQRSKTVL